ncbi:MAG: phBC6A51 family helix-turn-helix protein [Oscillospiraceae bacterium]|nr:phBC6A51 family helix-turn-helix protein [Oscillospiraceae bacterium]
MTGNVSPKQSQAVSALISCPTVKQAAAECGISERTIYRWLEKPDFVAALDKARQQVSKRITKAVISRAERAAKVLDEVMSDVEMPPPSRVSAAKCLLDTAFKAIETEEILKRIEALEKEDDL